MLLATYVHALTSHIDAHAVWHGPSSVHCFVGAVASPATAAKQAGLTLH